MESSATKTRRKKYSRSISKTKGSANPLSDARRVFAKEANSDVTEETHEKKEQQHVGGGGIKKKRKCIIVDKNDDGSANKEASPSKITKADLKARELWHKKSGAGYSFFVQYYGSQPRGIVTDDGNDPDDDKHNHSGGIETIESMNGGTSTAPRIALASMKQQGRGESRAAKKRRKKKKSSNNIANENNGKLSITLSAQSNASTEINVSSNTDKNCHDQKLLLSSELQHAMEYQTNTPNHLRYFLATLSKELPLTFRMRRHNEEDRINKFKQKIHTEFSHLIQPAVYNDDAANRSTIYQAIPDSHLHKKSLGKVSPELKSLILNSSSSGLIARQELGSMLPVIALEGGKFMTYGSKVLDMCASPGSKTLQALEIVASSQTTSDDKTKSVKQSKKPGRIVANDIHPLRIEALKDAISRSGLSKTLTDRIIFTNHDASIFPTPKSGKLFDCIIADVPCSGDGTIRKDPRILSGWMPSISNSLHSIQKKILQRAIRLVRVGGVVAYSTCSLNPIEDEAVVASVLSWANRYGQDNGRDARTKIDNNGEERSHNTNKVELLEWPKDALSRLKRKKGVHSWRVANYVEENEMNHINTCDRFDTDDMPQIQWYESFVEATADSVPHVVESMFPPLRKHSEEMNLDRCLRLLPQDNDTGGFFVALFRRIS